MYINVNAKNPDDRQVKQVAEMLRQGALIIYPTDSVYAVGCDPESKEGVEKLYNIKNSDPRNRQMTFMCDSISMAAAYAGSISNSSFRFIKDHTPGPYTFIMNATNKLPRVLGTKNKTFGFRIPDHAFCLKLIQELGRPVLSSSLKKLESEMEEEFYTNPEHIYSDYSLLVDAIVEGGMGMRTSSTIVDLTGEEPEVIREGLGVIETE
ncbi:MAG TPA: L-threonylcarbamoyladenylate synthase [Saprospiraceae bacterium]|nr:L-threonylcarbamoyladenylate synthase [Saprospiraceae bacterium]